MRARSWFGGMSRVDRGAMRPDNKWVRLQRAAYSRDISARTVMTIVAAVGALYLAGKVIYRLREVLLLLAVAGFIALVLNPLVVALQRRLKMRRWLAVAIIASTATLVLVGLAAALGYRLACGMAHLANWLPGYVAKAEHGKGWIGHLARRYHVQARVQHNTPKLVSFGQAFAGRALTLGRDAVSLGITVAIIPALVLLLLLEGPRLRTGVLALMPPERATRYSQLTSEASRSISGYVLGNLLTSVIAGVVVFVTLLTLGIPYPYLWALWVAALDFLPVIGGALAGIPTVLFAATHSLTAGIVVLVVFLIYTLVENHVLNPLVMSRTVRISPLLVLVSILIAAPIGDWMGGLFGGFVAALLAIPAAGAIQAIVRETWMTGQCQDGMQSADREGNQVYVASSGEDISTDQHIDNCCRE
jgi:predicted PurR-regulated permease PerM